MVIFCEIIPFDFDQEENLSLFFFFFFFVTLTPSGSDSLHTKSGGDELNDHRNYIAQTSVD